MLLDFTELSSYLPLVSSFAFGNVCGKLFPCTEGRVRTTMTSARTSRAGAFAEMAGMALVRAFLVWAWHHTSPIHARVAEASTRKNGTSNAASKEDDMNVHRECSTVQTFARGVCEQPFRMVEGLKGSVNHLVDG